MSRIVNDWGHGVGQDRGANGIISEESVINAVAPLVTIGLRNAGHTVLEVRPSSASSVYDSLNQRTNASDAFGADLFVSIHANASRGQGTGSEAWTFGAKRLPQAVNVCNNLAELGFPNRGIKDGSRLAVVRDTNAPAMLVETFFIDRQSDVDLYNRVGPQAIANAIIAGILGTSVVAYVAPIIVVTPEVSLTENSQARYWVGRVQQVCCAHGFNVKVDNWWGDKTQAAVGQLPLSGKAYKNVEATKFIQERLGLTVDGYFWNITDAAVRAWQQAHGLIVDGVVGFYTYRSLALQD